MFYLHSQWFKEKRVDKHSTLAMKCFAALFTQYTFCSDRYANMTPREFNVNSIRKRCPNANAEAIRFTIWMYCQIIGFFYHVVISSVIRGAEDHFSGAGMFQLAPGLGQNNMGVDPMFLERGATIFVSQCCWNCTKAGLSWSNQRTIRSHVESAPIYR